MFIPDGGGKPGVCALNPGYEFCGGGKLFRIPTDIIKERPLLNISDSRYYCRTAYSKTSLPQSGDQLRPNLKTYSLKRATVFHKNIIGKQKIPFTAKYESDMMEE